MDPKTINHPDPAPDKEGTTSNAQAIETNGWSCIRKSATHSITASKPIQCTNPDLVIQSDASNSGWGAVRDKITTGGRWTYCEQMEHINVLELQAAYFALKSLCGLESELYIQIQLDNSTAVAYINNMGGTKSLKLNNLALGIWEWCILHNIWISAVHIAGKTNVEADKQSHQFSDQHEWMLDKNQFPAIQNRYPLLEIDLFASRLNAQLPNYVAWQPDPECIAVLYPEVSYTQYHS